MESGIRHNLPLRCKNDVSASTDTRRNCVDVLISRHIAHYPKLAIEDEMTELYSVVYTKQMDGEIVSVPLPFAERLGGRGHEYF